jgi:hypothetical protein
MVVWGTAEPAHPNPTTQNVPQENEAMNDVSQDTYDSVK